MINKDFKEFHDFGVSSLDIKKEDFMSPGYVVQLVA